uniref:Uncharacterized protein n=1 Tax=Ananas comosus var. bracteatus TaxID=296719 RepID=A0A6V7QKL9_ANACO|nr:unnamed protein product [Ananas comosus var. bracteatus]
MAWRYRPPLTLRPLLLLFVAATPTLSSLGNTVASSRTTRRCSPRRPFVLSAFVVVPLRLRSPRCLSRPIALRLLSPCCLSRPTSHLPSPVLSAFSRPVACPVRHPVWEVALCRRSCGLRLFLHRTFSARSARAGRAGAGARARAAQACEPTRAARGQAGVGGRARADEQTGADMSRRRAEDASGKFQTQANNDNDEKEIEKEEDDDE